MYKKIAAAIFAALLSMAVLPAHGAQVLVIVMAENAGDTLKPGGLVKAGSKIELAAGAKIGLLNQAGRMVVLKGPYSGAVGAPPAAADAPSGGAVMTKLGKLIAGHDEEIGTGASRNLGAALASDAVPHPAFVSVMSSGHRCDVSGKPLLWRSSDATAATLSLENVDGEKASVTWHAGEDRLELPQKFVGDGSSFMATLGGKTVILKLHARPAAARNLTQILAWLTEKRCTGQAHAILRSLRKEAQGAG